MIDKEAIKRDVKKGIKDGSIKTYMDAENVALKHIGETEPSYEPCLQTSDLLTRKPKETIREKKFKHPWFKGKVTHKIYLDIWGRMWNQTKGVINDNIKTRKCSIDGHCIDMLGGMMWTSKKGRTYICEYRTNANEINERVNPETFIG